MLARRIKGGYQFESPTINGAFIVKLTLTDEGEEKLETCPVEVDVRFEPRILTKGTIEKAIGPERWANFSKMRDKKMEKMFIDPYKGKTSSRTW